MALVTTRHGLVDYIFVVFLVLIVGNRVSGDIVQVCKEQCNDEDACKQGCTFWNNSTVADCMSSCNQTYYFIGNTEVQYCSEGCEHAANEYANIVKGEIGTPTPPTLSSDLGDITNVSIPLTWDDAEHPAVSYRIQWMYADDPSSINRNYDVPPIKVNMLEVADLSPYVNYSFRVLWIITSLNYLYSNKSLPIQTLASGVPSSPPTIVSITSVSYSSIQVKWQPPFFINGPIQMYRLTVQPVDGSTDKVIDEETEEVREYTFRNLAGGVAYTVTIQARNGVGLGPAASENITTLRRPTYEGVTPNLVVGVNNFFSQSINALTTFDITLLESFEEANSVHELESDAAKLDGCAVYYTGRLYFFSDDAGRIHRRAEMDNQSTIIYNSTKHPKEMSVDWLYKKLYFIEDNQISRCDFDGGNIEVAVGNLDSTPTEIRVDSLNGYLFWSELNRGIFRLNLTNVVTNTNDKKLIITISTIQAFYVHSTDMLLYFPDEAGKKIYSANLDGTDQTMIKEIFRQTLQNVTSLVRYNQTFVWVEFTTEDLMYSFNGNNIVQVFAFGYPGENTEFRGMVVDHPSSQPYPVPLRPENAQALFTNNSAIVSWDELAETGSWQGWSYRVQAFDGNTLVSEANTSTNSAVLESLTASTSYEIRVIGFTPDGEGPASTPYRGETLQTAIPEPYLIAGTEQGIQRVGMDGSVQQPINSAVVNVEDIDWYGDIVIWSDSNEVSWTSISNPGSPTKINGISSAKEIAVDWLGGQLYWAEVQEVSSIKRAQWSTSDSSAVKPELVIESEALDIAIDSIRAYIYWVSVPLYYNSDPRPSGVECARLNNELGSRVTIYETEEFVDEQVVSLTLDLDGGFVYWLVWSGNLRLYKSVLADNNPRDLTPELVTEVQAGIQSPTLHYYSNRFFWISMNQYIAVASVDGNGLATISSVSANALTVVQNSLHPIPDGFTAETLVIPNAIPPDSIKIVGEDAGNFNVEWDASSEVTYAQVFYNLKIRVNNGEIISETRLTQPSYNMKDVPPYSQLDITVEAYTYYGLAPSSQSALRSPESVPSVPQNPRVFVSDSGDPLSNDVGYEAEFRWEAPSTLNGILLGYNVYWGTSPGSLSTENITDSTTTTYKAALEPNTLYYFQVDAYTSVGSGARTQLISTNTSAPTPVPMVLVFGASGLTRIDLDTNTEESVGISDILALGYIAQRNNMLYYIDGSDESIKQAEENGDNPDEILEIGYGLDPNNVGFAVDWLAQTIYWTEKHNEKSFIYFYDLTIGTLAKKTEIFVDNNIITSLTVNPQGKQLIWSVTTDGSILMTSDLNGKNVRPLIDQTNRRRRQVSCPASQSLAVFDPTTQAVFFASGNDIWSSDSAGQTCTRVVDGSSLNLPNGLPPDAISVDSSRLYWIKNGENLLLSILKADSSDLQTLPFDADLIVALDSTMQPYPASECLAPLPYSGSVYLIDPPTSMTLTLGLTPAVFGSVCGEIVTAAVVYKLKYTDGTTTWMKESTSTSVDLVGLTPYTNYSIQVSVSNYYSTGTPVPNSPVVFRTVEGVPSTVQNPSAVVLSPTEVMVTWNEPETVNGNPYSISYDIKFENINGEGIVETRPLVDVVRRTNSTNFYFEVDELIPSEMYNIEILAYYMSTLDIGHSTAEIEEVTMFEMPGQLLVMETTNFSIQLNWTSPSDGSVQSHEYQYKSVDMSSWLPLGTVEATTLNTVYEITIGNDTHPLRSNTQYEVRAKTYYASGRSSISKANSILTAAGLPDAPGQPSIESNRVVWKEADNNGAEIKQYILQARVQPDGKWYGVYTGADAFWIIANLTDKTTYLFRVAAMTDVGQGDFSIKSTPFDHISPTKGPITTEGNSIVLSVVIIVAVVLVLIIVASCILSKRRKKKPQQITVKFNSDTELAALRQYPRNLVKRDNQIYAVTNLENGEMVELPIFPRERLNLITFLGSGAFGEVFEGQAEDILGEGKGIAKVAVKTLRDKATDQEKEEFLKEAILMGNFKHPNILSLLGVCLDNDPQYIILELMEGGDLLNYLRAGRGVAGGPAKLTLLNLIDIIIDVAEGCKYLESMHFVHRDIAARNCLVSAKGYGVEDCSVKIGDFGLARDVYKSDYYRKEGEGLLPVRWMAPEAIVDGVFTNLSDVWAFGIVLWEILTLGQQPYPARSNVEVLQFVTEGGRLDSPENCPDDIYQLMIKCWSKQAASRPSFRSIVERLENFRRKSKAMSGADILGFETSAGMKLNYARIQPSADEYLDPITSKQSLVPDPPAFTDIDLSEPSSPTDSGMGTLKDNTTDEAAGEEGGGLKKKNSLRNSLRKMLPGSLSGRTKERTPLPELSRPPPPDFDNSKYSKIPRYGPAPVSRSGSKVSAISGEKPNYDEKGYNAELPPPPQFSTQSSSPVTPRHAGQVRHPNPFRADSDEEQDNRKYVNSSVINV